MMAWLVGVIIIGLVLGFFVALAIGVELLDAAKRDSEGGEL